MKQRHIREMARKGDRDAARAGWRRPEELDPNPNEKQEKEGGPVNNAPILKEQEDEKANQATGEPEGVAGGPGSPRGPWGHRGGNEINNGAGGGGGGLDRGHGEGTDAGPRAQKQRPGAPH